MQATPFINFMENFTFHAEAVGSGIFTAEQVAQEIKAKATYLSTAITEDGAKTFYFTERNGTPVMLEEGLELHEAVANFFRDNDRKETAYNFMESEDLVGRIESVEIHDGNSLRLNIQYCFLNDGSM